MAVYERVGRRFVQIPETPETRSYHMSIAVCRHGCRLDAVMVKTKAGAAVRERIGFMQVNPKEVP